MKPEQLRVINEILDRTREIVYGGKPDAQILDELFSLIDEHDNRFGSGPLDEGQAEGERVYDMPFGTMKAYWNP